MMSVGAVLFKGTVDVRLNESQSFGLNVPVMQDVEFVMELPAAAGTVQLPVRVSLMKSYWMCCKVG